MLCLICQTFGPLKAVRRVGEQRSVEADSTSAIYGWTPTPSWDDCSVWKYKQRNRRDEIRPSANEFSIVANFWEKGWTVCSYLTAHPTSRGIWRWSYKEKLMIGLLLLDTSQDLFEELGILSEPGHLVHLSLTYFWLWDFFMWCVT